MRIYLTLPIIGVLFTSLASCGFIPDPAVALANKIETNSRKLAESQNSTLTFEYTPGSRKLNKVSSNEGDVMIRAVSDKKSANSKDRSTIAVCEWFTTTYHNRFIESPRELKKIKKLGEPFYITLQKAGDTISWIDLR